MERLGQWFKSTREAIGISILEAEQKTKLRSKTLVAIEQGDYANLPPRIYVKGMVRTYAEYLGLDVDEALRLLDVEIGPEGGYALQQVAQPIPRPRITIGRVFAIFFVLAITTSLLAMLFQEYSRFVESYSISPSSVQPPAPEVVAAREIREIESTPTLLATLTPVPMVTPTPLSQITIETRITDRSYLKVTADDRVIYEAMPSAGETKVFTATDKLLLRVGNAGGVEVSFNGRKQGTMGSRGEVIERMWTKP